MPSNKLKINFILPELKYMLFKKKYMALVDITDKCNLRCKYCYHKDYLSSEDNTTLKEWERRFREYRKMGVKYISFIGGEPALRYDVLQLAENYFSFVETTTNGQIKIPEEFNHRIVLSFWGLEEEHDEICGKGTFKKMIGNYLSDKRVLAHAIFSQVNYKGEKKLKEFIDFIRTMDILGLRFSFLIPKIGEDNPLVLNIYQRQEIGEILLGELKRKDPVLLMTKGSVDFLTHTIPSARDCGYKNRVYFFTAQNKIKHCVDSTNDCSRCISLGKYDPSFYNFGEWFAQKLMLYKSFPKNKTYF